MPGATTVCGCLEFLAFFGLVVVVVLVPAAGRNERVRTRGWGEVAGGDVAGGLVTGGLVTGGGSVSGGGRLMGVVSTVVSGVPGSVVCVERDRRREQREREDEQRSDDGRAHQPRPAPDAAEIRDIDRDIAPGIIRPPVPYPRGDATPFSLQAQVAVRLDRAPSTRLNPGNR